MAKKRKDMPSVSKSKTILEEGEVKGKPLSKKQKGFFGMIAGGGTPTRALGGGGKGGRRGPPSAKHGDEMRRPMGDTGDYKVKRRGL